MERKVILEEISDGRKYTSGDMVKADCGGCEGCSSCCQGMGNSITLDPFDVHRMTTGLGKTFQELMEELIELQASEGIIMPNMRMAGEKEQCAGLNQEGRCTIHSLRPGVCRLFPLGRVYENDGFSYFLQTGECPKERKTKVKVRKWLDTPDLNRYEGFISLWHYFLKDLKTIAAKTAGSETPKQLNLYLLKSFYFEPYRGDEDFYSQFESRLLEARKVLETSTYL